MQRIAIREEQDVRFGRGLIRRPTGDRNKDGYGKD